MGAVIACEWLSVLGCLAVIGIVIVAFGVMLQILKPADALKHLGIILGATAGLILLPGIVARTWAGMHLWQQLALITLVTAFILGLKPQGKKRIKHRD